MHTVEDKTLLDSLITIVKVVGESIKITRNSGHSEYINIGTITPDMNQLTSTNKNYINNKPRTLEVATVNDFANPRDLDVATLPDGSKLLMANGQWQTIKRSLVDEAREIRVPLFSSGKIYKRGDVASKGNHLFSAIENTDDDPMAYGADWRYVSELDMFLNRCEVTTPKLFGYFDVSGEYWNRKLAEITTLEQFESWFSGTDRADRSDIVIDQEGMYLFGKDENVTEMNYWVPIDTGTRKILGIQIEGIVKTVDTYGGITMALDNGSMILEIADISTDKDSTRNRELLEKENGDKYDNYSITKESNPEFDFVFDTSRIANDYTKLNIKFWYNNSYDLSKHRIGKITIIYEDKE